MNKWIFSLLLTASWVSSAENAKLPGLQVTDRGELHLNDDNTVFYQPWQLSPLRAPQRAGLLMLVPARLASREHVAALEQALAARAADHSVFRSISIVNLADATWGAGLMIEGELKQKKTSYPEAHFVVDEAGFARETLQLSTGYLHVLLHDCQGAITLHHTGPVSPQQAQTIVQNIDEALIGPECSGNQPLGYAENSDAVQAIATPLPELSSAPSSSSLDTPP